MAYGLFQGLNQAYDSFRERERDIEAEGDRVAEREYRDTQRSREAEQYEYGLSRRKVEEEAANIQMTTARNELKLQQEQMTPEAVKARKEALEAQRKMLTMQVEEAGYKVNSARLANQAAIAKDKYNSWTRDWQQGLSVDELVNRFNTDEDQNNNIKDYRVDPETDGWIVEFEDGTSMPFEDRDAVGRHLQQMADPEFYQTWLLNQMKADTELAKKLADADKESKSNLKKEAEVYRKAVQNETDRLYGKMFPSGAIEFGEPGNKQLAQMVRDIANQIGASHKFNVLPSEVVGTISRLADLTVDNNPETRRRRALEIYEEMPEADFTDPNMYPDGKPDADEPAGEAKIKQILFDQAVDDLTALKLEAIKRYAINEPNGSWRTRDPADAGTDTGQPKITDEGLERPGTETPTEGAPEDKGLAAPEETGVKKQPRQRAGPAGREPPPPRRDMSDFLAKKRSEIGIVAGRPTTKRKQAHAKKVRQDYLENFESYDEDEKRAWLDNYGKELPPSLLAEAKAQLPQPRKTPGLDVGKGPRSRQPRV